MFYWLEANHRSQPHPRGGDCTRMGTLRAGDYGGGGGLWGQSATGINSSTDLKGLVYEMSYIKQFGSVWFIVSI